MKSTNTSFASDWADVKERRRCKYRSNFTILLWANLLLKAGFRKGRGTRDQIANIRWIIEKTREFQKNIYFCFTDYAKAFDYVDHNKLWKILKEMGMNTRPPDLPPEKPVCRSRSNS